MFDHRVFDANVFDTGQDRGAMLRNRRRRRKTIDYELPVRNHIGRV